MTPPDARKILGIILGASDFSRAELTSDSAFRESAQAFRQYLIGGSGLGLPRENILDLFDNDSSSSSIDEQIHEFLASRASALKAESQDVSDVVIYYTGHGLFTPPSDTYALALRYTTRARLGASSLHIDHLAEALRQHVRFSRRFVILDCCFAASAYSSFESEPLDVAIRQSTAAFITRGTALLCASAQDRPAKSRLSTGATPSGMTLFSESLMGVLTEGMPQVTDSLLSLRDVGLGVEQRMKAQAHGEGPRPQVKSPDERDGDPATVPLFPNVAYRDTPQFIRQRIPHTIQLSIYASVTEGMFHDRLTAAQERFAKEEYAESRQISAQVLDNCEALLANGNSTPGILRTYASCQLQIANTYICLQQQSEALEILRRVAESQIEHLDIKQCGTLAQGLAQLGEIDLASSLLDRDTVKNSHEESVRNANLLLKVMRGAVSDEQSDSPVVELYAARELMRGGGLQKSIRRVSDAISRWGSHQLLSLAFSELLLSILAEIAFSYRVQGEPISIIERRTVVELLESRLSWLSSASGMSASAEDDLVRFKFQFSQLTKDEEGVGKVLTQTQLTMSEAVNRYSMTPVDVAESLQNADEIARSGRLDEALKSLPPDSHPWQGQLIRAQLIEIAGDQHQALCVVRELAQDFPGCAPIEWHLAYLLLRTKHPTEALSHAEMAFSLLPGWGYRLMFAQCLLFCQHHSRAFTALSPLEDSEHPEVIRILALAAEEVDRSIAIKLWERHKTLRPEASIYAAIRICKLHLLLGATSDAADYAWDLVMKSGSQLTPGDLYACAKFQLAGGSLPDPVRRQRIERVRRVISFIDVANDNNPEVEFLRFLLLSDLGFPNDAKPLDLDRLSRHSDIHFISFDEALAMRRRDQMRFEAIYHLYRAGRLGFESVCDLLPTQGARLLVHFRGVAGRNKSAMLCAPVATRGTLPACGTPDVRLLLGSLESLLLQQFSLLEEVPRNYPDVRVYMFADAWVKLQAESVEIESRTQRIELENQHHLLAYLRSEPVKIRFDLRSANPRLSDEDAAKEQGIVVVSEPPEEVSETTMHLSVLAAYLYSRGGISDDQARLLGHSDDTINLPEELPSILALMYSPLIRLMHAEALPALLEHVTDHVIIGQQALGLIQSRIEELQLVVDAAELASATAATLRRGIAEGWFLVDLPRPEISDLPALQASMGQEESFRREPLVKGFSYRQALRSDPSMLLLSADYFSASSPGNESLAHLEWSGLEHIEAFQESMRAAEPRIIGLSRYIRSVVSPERKVRVLDELTRLGFTDAFDAEAILEVAAQHGGLAKGRPAAILDSMERPLRQSGMHPTGAPLEALVLAGVYAATIGKAFLGALPSDLDVEIMNTLGERAVHLGDAVTPLFPDFFMELAANQVLSDPMKAFGPPDAQKSVSWSRSAPVSRLWEHLSRLASSHPTLQASFMRAVREIWLFVDDARYPDGPDSVEAGALMGSVFARPQSVLDAALEAPAILSSNWKHRPLARVVTASDAVNLEQQFQDVAASMGSEDEVGHLTAREFIQHDGKTFSAESILLRAPKDVLARAAGVLAHVQGIHDGRAYHLFSQLGDAPTAEALRRRVARNAVLAPWRLIRDDIAYISTWHIRGRLGFPSDLVELCDLLSEPHLPDGSQLDPLLMVARRLGPAGFWRDRSDRYQLRDQALQVPGALAAQSIGSRLGADRAAIESSKALRRLERCREYPTAVVMSDIFLVVVLAAKLPGLVPSRGSGKRLASLLPEVLVSVLRECASPSDSLGGVSLANLEGGLLRLCRLTVTSLPARRRVSREESLWLSYRLFQWFCAQWEVVDLDANKALIELARRCPPSGPLPLQAREVLEPVWFDPARFDHRLAGVLLALATCDEVVSQVYLRGAGRRDAATSPLDLSILIRPLVALTERALTEDERTARKLGDGASKLGWAGPTAIPEIALFALIKIRRDAFFSLLPEQRCRWLSDLPRTLEDSDRVGWILASAIVTACVEYTERLSAEERSLFLHALDAMETREAGHWRIYAHTRLLISGDASLEGTVRAEIMGALDIPLASHALGEFLVYIARERAEQLNEEIVNACLAIEAYGKGVTLTQFFVSLSVLARLGGQSATVAVLDFLLNLRAQSRYKNKLQLRRLIRGIRKILIGQQLLRTRMLQFDRSAESISEAEL